MSKTIEITNLQDGQVGEILRKEVANIMEDIQNGRKSPTATRRLAIGMAFEPNEEGTSVSLRIDIKPTLAPLKPIETMLGISSDGNITEQIQEKMELGDNEDAA